MIDTTTKPRRFYQNLLAWGFRFEVDAGGQLVVTTPPACGRRPAQVAARRRWQMPSSPARRSS